MQELILRSDVEKMIQSMYKKYGYPTQDGLLEELSKLESKYEAVAHTPDYILANRIWKSIDIPPHTEGQYLVIDEYIPGQPAMGIGYYSPLGWESRASYTHWMELPNQTS